MATEGRQAQRGRQWVIVVGALLVAVGAVIIWLGLARDPTPYQRADGSFDWVAWGLPSWAPEPVVPDDNPMSFAKIDLGRHLFYDKRLSGNQTMSCGTCGSRRWTAGARAARCRERPGARRRVARSRPCFATTPRRLSANCKA